MHQQDDHDLCHQASVGVQLTVGQINLTMSYECVVVNTSRERVYL